MAFAAAENAESVSCAIEVPGDAASGQTIVARADQYSSLVCSIFMLNLVLGTGPMTLPYAFNGAGLVLSMVFLCLLMTLSFVTATFVVESLATADRLRQKTATAPEQRAASEVPQALLHGGVPSGGGDGGGGSSLGEQAEDRIVERLEIGAIAEALLPGRLSILPYIVLVVYAYGVLSVYVISGVSSLAKEVGVVGGVDSYNIILVCFILLVTPICLLDFQRTRPLQICIGFIRIFVVVLMMVLMVRYQLRRSSDANQRTWRDIPLWNPAGLPSLFGNSAFTFMIHHSIPGLVFPLRRHRSAAKAIARSYLLAYLIYFVLGFLALLSFSDVQWSTCPNFPSHPCDIQALFNTNFASSDFQWAAKFIVCYPILVISVFPLVAITLRNNLKALCGAQTAPAARAGGVDWRTLGFTSLAVGPPFLVASVTRDVQVVMTYVGGYFGLSLMFLVPTLLVLYARRDNCECSSLGSLFRCRCCVGGMLIAFVTAIVFNTVNLSLNHR